MDTLSVEIETLDWSFLMENYLTMSRYGSVNPVCVARDAVWPWWMFTLLGLSGCLNLIFFMAFCNLNRGFVGVVDVFLVLLLFGLDVVVISSARQIYVATGLGASLKQAMQTMYSPAATMFVTLCAAFTLGARVWCIFSV